MKILRYEVVDDLAFAASLDRLDAVAETFEVVDLGPFIELAYLSRLLPRLRPVAGACSAQAQLPPVASASSGARLWFSADGSTGVLRTQTNDVTEEGCWIRFGLAAQQAAKQAGFVAREPAQMVGAMSELCENIYEHAGNAAPGVVTFRAARKSFEFVISDGGRGVLASLRTAPKYAKLSDDAEALRLALQEGVSRFDDPQRGCGFRPLFIGLAELDGTLRFRSGAAALTIDGTLDLMTAKLSQKASYAGFHVSVICHTGRKRC